MLKLQQDNSAEAADLIAQAVSVRPNAIDALSNLSGVYLMLNRHAEALVQWDRVLAIQGDDVAACKTKRFALALNGHSENLAKFTRSSANRLARISEREPVIDRVSCLRRLGTRV